MPIFVQGSLRQRQRAMEENGLIQTRNSIEQQEFPVTKAPVPIYKLVFRGTQYVVAPPTGLSGS